MIHLFNALMFMLIFFRVIYVVLLACIIVFLAVDTRKKPIRFLSLLGLVVYIFIAYLLSRHRSKVMCSIRSC